MLEVYILIFYKIRYILEELYVAVFWIKSQLIIYIDYLNTGIMYTKKLSWNKEMHVLKSNFLSSQMDSHNFSPTLESGINIALPLLIFWLFPRGYGLIPDCIVPI